MSNYIVLVKQVPDVTQISYNAFNPEMIEELLSLIKNIKSDPKLRSILFTGNGKSFSAGADLNWMSEMINYTYDENIGDSENISKAYGDPVEIDRMQMTSFYSPTLEWAIGDKVSDTVTYAHVQLGYMTMWQDAQLMAYDATIPLTNTFAIYVRSKFATPMH